VIECCAKDLNRETRVTDALVDVRLNGGLSFGDRKESGITEVELIFSILFADEDVIDFTRITLTAFLDEGVCRIQFNFIN
jgi:hypothetical protein